jgi:hypothetical protein
MVFLETGERPVIGQKLATMSPAKRASYLRWFADSRSTLTPNVTPYEGQKLRVFTSEERRYLGVVAAIMHRDLMKDTQALAYLAQRGCDPWPFIGVARHGQLKELKGVAKELGDPSLVDRVGITSTHPQHLGKMHILVQDSIMVFQLDQQEGVYYQARTLRTDRKNRYYNPEGIERRHLVVGNAPRIGAEGFFKGAWALSYGFGLWAPLGSQAADKLPADKLKPLHNGIYVADRDVNQAGQDMLKTIKNRAYLSGIDAVFTYPPNQVKELDEWATSVGYKEAAKRLQILLASTSRIR